MKDVHVLQKAGVYRLSLKVEESFSIFSNRYCKFGRNVEDCCSITLFSFGARKSQHLHWKCFRRFSFQESTFQYELKLLSSTKPCTCPSSYGCNVPSILLYSQTNKKKFCSQLRQWKRRLSAISTLVANFRVYLFFFFYYNLIILIKSISSPNSKHF